MLYCFNPGHEGAVLSGNIHYTLPAHPLKMAEDLAFLPAWYADPTDFIFVSENFQKDFLDPALQNLIAAPLKESEMPDKKNFLSGTEFMPWGVSPDILHRFRKLDETYNLNLTFTSWDENFKPLCSRITARDCLKEIVAAIPEIDAGLVPSVIETEEAIEKFLKENEGMTVVKAPLSSSGRGIQWIGRDTYDRSRRQIIHGMLKRQGYVCVEKALFKVCDFAMLFFSSGKGEIRFSGYSVFQTDGKGNYLGNKIASQPALLDTILSQGADIRLLETIKETLSLILRKKYKKYRGALGVDMMLYRDKESRIRLQPCVEINMRFSMGWPAMKISNLLFAGSSGHFYISYGQTKGRIYKENISLREKYPLILENGTILSGYLPLCPLDENSSYNAYITIEHDKRK